MNQQNARLTLVGGVATCLAACATTPVAAPAGPTAADYAPIPVGASWTYEVEYPGQKGEMTVQLLRRDGEYVVDNRNGTYRHTQDGLRDRDRYLIRHPLVAGTEWKAVVGPSAVERLSIVSVGQPCEAAAGRFEDCLVVAGRLRRDKSMALTIEWTWARGVGLVKLKTAAEVKGKGKIPQISQSLKTYRLDGTPAAEAAGDDGPDTWTTR